MSVKVQRDSIITRISAMVCIKQGILTSNFFYLPDVKHQNNYSIVLFNQLISNPTITSTSPVHSRAVTNQLLARQHCCCACNRQNKSRCNQEVSRRVACGGGGVYSLSAVVPSAGCHAFRVQQSCGSVHLCVGVVFVAKQCVQCCN